MKRKRIRFRVTFYVEDHGDLDTGMLGGGIDEGLGVMQREGTLTGVDDLTTQILHWDVEQLDSET